MLVSSLQKYSIPVSNENKEIPYNFSRKYDIKKHTIFILSEMQRPTDSAEEVSAPEPNVPLISKPRVIKNLIVVSLSWWMLFSAYDGLLLLQSTINSKKGVGVISVSIQYAMGCLTAILLPKYVIQKLGQKTVLVCCIALHLPFIAANFYPSWLLMIPSSIMLGGANPLLWAALCSYLKNLSSLYHAHLVKTHPSPQKSNLESELSLQVMGRTDDSGSKVDLLKDDSTLLESTIARFFGFHGAIYQTCHISSNIASYFILSMDVEGSGYVKNNDTCRCGIDFCNDNAACFSTNLKPPSDTLRYILTAVCVLLGIFALILIVLFMDEIVEKKKDTTFSLDLMMSTCKLMKRVKTISLIPLSLYIGVFQGFVFSDYTQAYVGCAWGIHNIGLVTAVLGIGLSLSSTMSGWFVRYVGRHPIFLISKVMCIAFFLVLFFVPPDGERPAVMLVMGGISGAILGIYWSQLRAFYGVLFSGDEEAAFGNYQLWHSVGVCISFGSNKYLCTATKVYITIFVSTAGYLGYLLAEILHSRREPKGKR